MSWIIEFLICAGAFLLGAQVLRGVKVDSYVQALVVVAIVAVLDMTLGTVLKIVTLGILSLSILKWKDRHYYKYLFVNGLWKYLKDKTL